MSEDYILKSTARTALRDYGIKEKIALLKEIRRDYSEYHIGVVLLIKDIDNRIEELQKQKQK